MQAGDNKRAHLILLDLFNVVPPTPEQAKLIAKAANAAGDIADSYYYMSEYHIMSGDLLLAVNQLQLALALPGINPVQRARFSARLAEIREVLPKDTDHARASAGGSHGLAPTK
jgi:predicted Zn-dependent protease